MARTIVIHSDVRSPQGAITAELWTISIDHTVWLYNQMHHKDYGLSTYELWNLSLFLHSKEILST